MFRLVYTSRSHRDLSSKEISQILNTARKRNARDGLTGLLLYHNRRILQVLEGSQDKVEACFERVRYDPRHGRVVILSAIVATNQFFTDWFMGCEAPERLSVSDENKLITLEQLKARLAEVARLDMTNGRKDVMRSLSMYLMSLPQTEKETT